MQQRWIKTFRKGWGGWGGGGGEGLCSSRPSDKAGGGLVSKNFLLAFWASVWSKNKGRRRAPPQDLPLCTLHVHKIVMVNLRNKFHLEKYQYAKYAFSQSQ